MNDIADTQSEEQHTKTCPKCGFEILTDRVTCPICFGVLQKHELVKDYQKYPANKIYPRATLVTKIFIFISIVISIFSIVANYMTYDLYPQLWSILTISAILYLWLLIKFCILGRGLISSRIVVQIITTAIIVIAVQAIVVQNNLLWWSLNYVLPALLSIGMLSTNIIVMIKKNLFIDSILSLITMGLLGFLPYILSKTTPLYSVVWPSIVCAGISIATMVAMAVFHYRDCKEELTKRFHI